MHAEACSLRTMNMRSVKTQNNVQNWDSSLHRNTNWERRQQSPLAVYTCCYKTNHV